MGILTIIAYRPTKHATDGSVAQSREVGSCVNAFLRFGGKLLVDAPIPSASEIKGNGPANHLYWKIRKFDKKEIAEYGLSETDRCVKLITDQLYRDLGATRMDTVVSGITPLGCGVMTKKGFSVGETARKWMHPLRVDRDGAPIDRINTPLFLLRIYARAFMDTIDRFKHGCFGNPVHEAEFKEITKRAGLFRALETAFEDRVFFNILGLNDRTPFNNIMERVRNAAKRKNMMASDLLEKIDNETRKVRDGDMDLGRLRTLAAIDALKTGNVIALIEYSHVVGMLANMGLARMDTIGWAGYGQGFRVIRFSKDKPEILQLGVTWDTGSPKKITIASG